MSSGVAQSVSRNVAILSLQKIITLASTFFVLLFLPRYLGPVDYGRFYLGLTIVSMFSLLIDFGGNYSITKAVSRAREDVGHILADSMGARAVLWTISIILVISFSFIAGYHRDLKIIIVILSLGMIWSTVRSVLTYCYQGFEMMKYPSYGIILESAFIAAIGVPALLLGLGAIGFAVLTALSWLVNCLLCVKYANLLTRSLPRIQWRSSLRLLKEGLPYFLNSVFGIIYFRIDSILLSLMTPERVMGWYGAAHRFFDSLMFVPNIFSIAVFPVLSRVWVQENDSMARRFQRSLELMLLAGIPISICAFAFSSEVIVFFFGLQGYGPSILLMKIFSAGMLLLYIDWMLSTTMLASDKQQTLSKIAFSMIFVNVALNYLLIPYTQTKFGNGAIGSAIATLVTEFIIMISMILTTDKSIFLGSEISNQLKAIGAGIVMMGSIWFLAHISVNWIVQAIIGTLIYFSIVLYLGAIRKSDLLLMRSIIPQRFLRRKPTDIQ